MTGAAAPVQRASALEDAGSAVEKGGATPWGADSAHGPAATASRRALRRGLRAFETRQREIDGAILDALREVDDAAVSHHGGLAPLGLAATLDPEQVFEQATEIGTLWLRRDDRLVAPSIVQHRHYAPDLVMALEHRLARGGTFIDVGANIGYLSIAASRMVGPRGRVFSVEPDPGNLPVLRANLWRNRCDNATVLPVAAWSVTGHLGLVLSSDGGAATEVSADAGEGQMVPAVRLDEVISGRVDAIKIDAQMTDHLAIQGAERIIADNPSILVIAEFFPAALRSKDEDPEEILAYYRSLGLQLHLLNRPSPGLHSPASPNDILEACEDPRIPFVDVVLARA